MHLFGPKPLNYLFSFKWKLAFIPLCNMTGKITLSLISAGFVLLPVTVEDCG